MRKSCLSVIMLFAGHSFLWSGAAGSHSWVLKSMSQVENNSSLVHFQWEICRPPYGPYDTITLHYFDYDDNPIDLPMIAFLTPYIGCMFNNCLMDTLPNKTINDDVTINLLTGYGHMDVLFGKDSLTDVKQPLLDWLNTHAQAMGAYTMSESLLTQDEVESFLESILKSFFHISY